MTSRTFTSRKYAEGPELPSRHVELPEIEQYVFLLREVKKVSYSPISGLHAWSRAWGHSWSLARSVQERGARRAAASFSFTVSRILISPVTLFVRRRVYSLDTIIASGDAVTESYELGDADRGVTI